MKKKEEKKIYKESVGGRSLQHHSLRLSKTQHLTLANNTTLYSYCPRKLTIPPHNSSFSIVSFQFCSQILQCSSLHFEINQLIIQVVFVFIYSKEYHTLWHPYYLIQILKLESPDNPYYHVGSLLPMHNSVGKCGGFSVMKFISVSEW